MFDAIPMLSALREEDREVLAPLSAACASSPKRRPCCAKATSPTASTSSSAAASKSSKPPDRSGRADRPWPCSNGAHFRERDSDRAVERLSIPEREFFEKRPEMMRLVLAGLTQRLMMVDKRVADMTGSAESRGALVSDAGRPRRRRARRRHHIPMALTRQEIADLIGTTLETAIRFMSRWQKQGVVMTEKGGFVLADAERCAVDRGVRRVSNGV